VSEQVAVTGAPYPGAPVTYVEAQQAGVALRAPRWGLPDVVVSIVLAVLVPLLVLGGALAAGAPMHGTLILLGSAMLPWVGFGLWPILTTRLQGNGPRIDLGFTVRPKDVLWGVGGGVIAILAGTVVAAITQFFLGSFSSTAGDAVSNADVPRWVVYAFAVCALVGAPVFEELCFRGLAFAAVARWAASRGLPAVPWATIASAVLFTLVHLEPVRIPVLLTIGLVLSTLRAYTGRVGAGIIAHACNNLIGVLAILTGTG
jgi:membrane protease YdiL (CAAX protease family)